MKFTKIHKGFGWMLLLLISTLIVVGCKPDKDVTVEKSESLVGTQWELEELGGKALSEYGELESVPFLEFSDSGRVSGSLSCNRLSGGFEELSETTLRFSQVAATKKMCANMSVEDAFLSVLNVIDHFRIEGDHLYLSVGGDAPMAKLLRTSK